MKIFTKKERIWFSTIFTSSVLFPPSLILMCVYIQTKCTQTLKIDSQKIGRAINILKVFRAYRFSSYSLLRVYTQSVWKQTHIYYLLVFGIGMLARDYSKREIRIETKLNGNKILMLNEYRVHPRSHAIFIISFGLCTTTVCNCASVRILYSAYRLKTTHTHTSFVLSCKSGYCAHIYTCTFLLCAVHFCILEIVKRSALSTKNAFQIFKILDTTHGIRSPFYAV